MTNPLEATEDKAEEDSILDDANLDVYPGGSEESPEAYNQCFLTLMNDARVLMNASDPLILLLQKQYVTYWVASEIQFRTG